MKDLENIRRNQILEISNELIPNINYEISENKKYQKYLGKYHPNNENEVNKTENQKIEYIPGQNLNKDIIYYEKNRMDEKLIYSHFINYKLVYHCKAIEILSELYKSVKNLNKDSIDANANRNNNITSNILGEIKQI